MNRTKILTGLLDLRKIPYEEIRDPNNQLMRVFISNFVSLERQEAFLLNLNRRGNKQKRMEYSKHFSAIRRLDLENGNCSLLDWISSHGRDSCYVLWNTPKDGALLFSPHRLLDIELSYFGDGYLCNFSMNKVIAVTLDNEIYVVERNAN